MVRAIGADRTIDYGKVDFTRGDERYDLIFDLVSNHPFSALRRVVSPGGMVVAAGGPGFDGLRTGRWAARQIGGLLASRFAGAKMSLLAARDSRRGPRHPGRNDGGGNGHACGRTQL